LSYYYNPVLKNHIYKSSPNICTAKAVDKEIESKAKEFLEDTKGTVSIVLVQHALTSSRCSGKLNNSYVKMDFLSKAPSGFKLCNFFLLDLRLLL
jgi:hypothetical protein